jgi:hypothetical protein
MENLAEMVALTVIAASRDGRGETVLLAHGTKPALLNDLLPDGLATSVPSVPRFTVFCHAPWWRKLRFRIWGR